MIGIIIALAILVIAETIWLLVLWRQHLKICRQLQFVREQDSCLLVSVNVEHFGELKLAEEINRTLEDVRERKHELSEKEKLIADAYANLSHDIRTPLTSLDGYVQLLRDAATPEEQARYTAIIWERIETLKELLEDLFTFTKLKNGKYEPELEIISLRSVTAETVLSYYDVWKEAGVDPEIDLTEEVLPILGNELAVKRILQNITKNAMVHGHKSIFVTLRKRDERTAEVVIANPVEHPEEIEISRVFEQFYTADRYHQQASSGLGLAIAKEFTERMNGTIGASLDGNRFFVTITFPLQDKNPEV
ncbi:MAG: HAMP domain-containing histidine kinase [Lachnospiraceae bacterium]|nr:HAMP domain-containing histidine kinase [Lachnospiraceae bacterium]